MDPRSSTGAGGFGLFCLASTLLLLLSLAHSGHTLVRAHVHTTPFQVGDEVHIECRRNLTAFPEAFPNRLPARTVDPHIAQAQVHGTMVDESEQWGPAIMCSETGRELTLTYGQDGFLHCGWLLANEDTYQFARSVMQQESGWNCRVPMSADRTFYLPLVIPLWGVVEATHLHLNQHLNFVVHADEGRIIGISAYPVRDQFQFGRVGSMIQLHGPVKWFRKHSFLSLATGSADDEGGSGAGGTGVFGVMRQSGEGR